MKNSSVPSSGFALKRLSTILTIEYLLHVILEKVLWKTVVL